MGQINILYNGFVFIPLGLNWIRCGQNGGSSIQLANNSSLTKFQVNYDQLYSTHHFAKHKLK